VQQVGICLGYTGHEINAHASPCPCPVSNRLALCNQRNVTAAMIDDTLLQEAHDANDPKRSSGTEL
jgi:hypothetical protein